MKTRLERIIAWFEHSIRCVLMTPFGWPVEPEVNRNLAILSGPTLSCATSTAGVGCAAKSSLKEVQLRPAGGAEVATTSTSDGTAAAVARADAAPLAANTRPGVSSAMMAFSLPKSADISE